MIKQISKARRKKIETFDWIRSDVFNCQVIFHKRRDLVCRRASRGCWRRRNVVKTCDVWLDISGHTTISSFRKKQRVATLFQCVKTIILK